MPLKAIRPRRLYRQIADQLAALIARGEYVAGDTLPPERELAERLGVSRTSVREALIALEVAGMVRAQGGSGGVVVADAPAPDAAPLARLHRTPALAPDPALIGALDFATEIPPFALLQARRLVEPESASLAALHASVEALDEIRAAFEQSRLDNRRQRLNEHNHGDRRMHILIAEASGNPAYALWTRHLLGQNYGPMFRRLQARYTPDDMPLRSEREHEAIVAALVERDPVKARAAMRAHLDAVIRIFSTALARD